MDTAVYILLGLTSVVGLTFIVERAWTLQWNKVVPPPIADALTVCRSRADAKMLCRLCEQHPSPLGRLLLLAGSHLDWPKADNVDALQTAARHEIVRLERGLVVLEIIVGIAPLLGLVGTIVGHDDGVQRHRADRPQRRRQARARHQRHFAGHAHRPADLHPGADFLELFQQKNRGHRRRDGGAVRRIHPPASIRGRGLASRIWGNNHRTRKQNPRRQTPNSIPHLTCTFTSANAAPRPPSSSWR